MSLRARVVILADDLSGAADCAAPFTRAGQDVLVAFGPDDVSDAHVVAIDLDTRRMTEEEARTTARAAAEQLADKATGGNGVAGLSAATTAGNAAAVPALVAAANPAYEAAAKYATVLVAASVVVTSLVVPIVTAWWAGRVKAAGGEVGPAESPGKP